MVIKEDWICAIALIVGALIFNYFFLHSGKSKLHPFEVQEDISVLHRMTRGEPDAEFKLELTNKIKVTDDTYIFRFGFPKENYVFGLPIGKHVVFSVPMVEPG